MTCRCTIPRRVGPNIGFDKRKMLKLPKFHSTRSQFLPSACDFDRELKVGRPEWHDLYNWQEPTAKTIRGAESGSRTDDLYSFA